MKINILKNTAVQKRFHPQHGYVLIVVLLMLTLTLALTAAAVSSAFSNEKMTGASRDANLAFQAAEASLAAAESCLMAQNCVNVVRYDQALDTDVVPSGDSWVDRGVNAYWTHFDWSKNGRPFEVYSLTNEKKLGYYFIERLADVGSNPPKAVFRITAYGVGGTSDSSVLLQTIYQLG